MTRSVLGSRWARICVSGLVALGAVGGASSAAIGASQSPPRSASFCGTAYRNYSIYGASHITAAEICTALKAFVTWDSVPGHREQLYTCVDKHLGIGKPKLKVNTVAGYHVALGKEGGITLSRGPSAFSFVGFSDAPVGCD